MYLKKFSRKIQLKISSRRRWWCPCFYQNFRESSHAYIIEPNVPNWDKLKFLIVYWIIYFEIQKQMDNAVSRFNSIIMQSLAAEGKADQRRSIIIKYHFKMPVWSLMVLPAPKCDALFWCCFLNFLNIKVTGGRVKVQIQKMNKNIPKRSKADSKFF